MQASEIRGDCESHFVSTPDGLNVHVSIYGPRTSGHLPVVCLPGLARTGADFDRLASSLARDHERPRRVLALDSRGRGRSDYDRDARNYNIATELADLVAVLTAVELPPAVFIGTSRGGILAMLLASARPSAIAAVILNDIGPVVDLAGLLRIKSYVGKLPPPKSFADAADILRRLFAGQFPKLSAPDWDAFARRTFKERAGRIVPDYDPKIARTLDGIDVERTLPSLWAEFDALAGVPVMVIRGANSDILSTATVEAMRTRRALDIVEVEGEGHAPLLADDAMIGRIGAFIASCEELRRPS
jgi:pimeloyl-ACP methyl ester carboxylesterase